MDQSCSLHPAPTLFRVRCRIYLLSYLSPFHRSSRNCLDGQIVESSVPFLSPFPSPSHHVLVPAGSFTANTKQALSQNTVAITSLAEGSSSNLPPASCKEAEEGSEGMFDVDLEVPTSSLSCLSVGPASVEPALCKPSLPASAPTLNCTPSSNPTGKPGPSPPKQERKTGELIDLNSTTIPIPVTSITDITSNKPYGMLPSRWKRDDGKSDAAEQSWLFAVASTPARFSSSLEFLIGDCSGGSSSSSTSSTGLKKNSKERVLDPNHLVSQGPLRLPVETVDKNMFHPIHQGADIKVGGTSEIPPMIPMGSAMYDVRDKLLCIAEDLLNEQHTRITSDDSAAVAVEGDTINPKREGMIYSDDGSGRIQVPSEVEALQASLKAESRQRTDTAKKLLLLANIISGRASIQEYASLYDEVP